jgi:hypothetical protein
MPIFGRFNFWDGVLAQNCLFSSTKAEGLVSKALNNGKLSTLEN